MSRSSAFFQQNIRDYEYDCVLALAMEALDYDDIVLINAPFTQEVRDNAFIANLKAKLAAKGATLAVIWVETSPEVVHQRMIERNSDRDTWKLAHWDEYLRRCNFAVRRTSPTRSTRTISFCSRIITTTNLTLR